MSNAPENLFRLDGHHALITGASSGLGRHFAVTLARAGAHVALAARRTEALRETLDEVEAAGGRGVCIAMDVTDAVSVERALDAVTAHATVDVLINNAGVGANGSALTLSEADWDTVVASNLKGPWLVAMGFARRLVAAEADGAVVNIASILAERVANNVAPYAVSKAGLVQMTRVLALEWARHGIRVNALLPGYVSTPMNADFLASEAGERLRLRIPSRRFAEADDLNGALLLLASDASRHITGAAIPVDGGHLVSSL